MHSNISALPNYTALGLVMLYALLFVVGYVANQRRLRLLKSDLANQQKVKINLGVVKKEKSFSPKQFYVFTNSQNADYQRVSVSETLYEQVEANHFISVEYLPQSKFFLQATPTSEQRIA